MAVVAGESLVPSRLGLGVSASSPSRHSAWWFRADREKRGLCVIRSRP
jgi:hypothetical protein